MREKAERQRAELQQRQQHYAALKPADVAAVPWTQAKEINYVAGGSGGVLLVDLGDQCVALKPQGKNSVSELLAQHVAPHCSARVAQFRVVRHGEAEHQEILQVHVDGLDCPVVGAEKALATTIFRRHKNYNDGRIIGRGASFFGVLEYVPGHPLIGMEAQSSLEAAGDAAFLAMGRLCALDVLINNMDRLPLPVWDNEGNLGNVMLTRSGCSDGVMGIDQQVNLILPGPGQERYFERVRHLVTAAAAPGQQSAADTLGGLTEALTVNCGVELTEDHAALVLQGLLAGLQVAAQSWRDGHLQASLADAMAVCRERLQEDPTNGDELYYLEERLQHMAAFVSSVAEQVAHTLNDCAVA